MSSASSGPPAPRLAGIRSRWLAAVTASLDADPAVAGLGLAGWPADSTPAFDRPGIPRLTVTFTEHLAAEHEPPAPRSPAERRALQLALVPIAGKLIARRSPKTVRMIEILGGSATPGATWTDHLATVRQRLRDLTPAGPAPSATAARAYLTLVEATLLDIPGR